MPSMRTDRPAQRVLELASAAPLAPLAKPLALVAVSALVLMACAGARGTPVQAPVELQIAPIGTLVDGGIVTTGEPASGRCSLRLVAGRIQKSSPGCYLDEHISQAPGVLFYPCNGEGPAEAEFGEQRYAGRVHGGAVEVELTTELDWEDGCHWGTRAVIVGTVVSNGEPTLGKLSWLYQDHVMTGTDCSGVCTAKTSIDVMSVKGRAPEMPAARDEDDDDDD